MILLGTDEAHAVTNRHKAQKYVDIVQTSKEGNSEHKTLNINTT